MNKAVCILIENNDGRFLGVSRKHNYNDFGLPGGAVEPGENGSQAIIRELKEETGLNVHNLYEVFTSYNGVTENNEYEVVTFRGTVTGEIHTAEEGKVAWVTMQTLLDGSFGKYNRELFKQLNLLK